MKDRDCYGGGGMDSADRIGSYIVTEHGIYEAIIFNSLNGIGKSVQG